MIQVLQRLTLCLGLLIAFPLSSYGSDRNCDQAKQSALERLRQLKVELQASSDPKLQESIEDLYDEVTASFCHQDAPVAAEQADLREFRRAVQQPV